MATQWWVDDYQERKALEEGGKREEAEYDLTGIAGMTTYDRVLSATHRAKLDDQLEFTIFKDGIKMED